MTDNHIAIKKQAFVLTQNRQFEQARALYARICAEHTSDPESWFMLGALNGQLGRFEEAIECCRRVIALQPGNIDAHYNLAQACMRQNDPEAAISSYREVLRLQPRHAVALNNLGYALQQLGRHAEAVACHQQALQIQPNDAEARNNLGNALLENGKHEEAETAYREALRVRPDYAEAHFNLGNLFHRRGRLEQAVACYQQALRCRPDYFHACLNLGKAFSERYEHQVAVEYFQRALNLRPDSADVCFYMSRPLRKLGKLGEAAKSLQRALCLRPDYVEARLAMGYVLKEQGQQDAAERAVREILQLQPGHVEAHSVLLSSLNSSEADAAAVYEEHREWARRHVPPLPAAAKFDNTPNPDRRLRIGYVSPDFRMHSVAFFFEPILIHHDSAQFDAICYSNVARPDAITQRLQQHAEAWRDIYGLADEQVAALVREDKVDILVDLAGHTSQNRLMVFGRRPAPVQVTYLGYPNTTGLAAMDYRLTDAWADPPGMTEHLHTETLVRLPRGFLCYLPSPGLALAPGPLPARAAGYITFGSFNNLAKITPGIIACWARILQGVPGSRMIIKNNSLSDADTCARVRAVFARHGINHARIDLIGWMPTLRDHLIWYERIDLALDTYPYNGTTTTCEALWMGVPVVTCAGRTHVSRVGASLLSQTGLTDFIATDQDDYAARAIRWANDVEGLARLRAQMRNRLAGSPLCDGVSFARDVETAFREMWRSWCHGRISA